MDAIKEYLRAVDRLEHGEINLGEYDKLCEPLRDVRENAHGEWIAIINDGECDLWECSICHERSCCKGKYCMDCGADMRERREQ